jgi:hypothetical protein
LLLFVFHPQLAQGAHGRDVRETVLAKALHAPAFVVDTNEQVVAHGLDVGAQLRQLLATGPVATKQNDAACERVLQSRAICCAELRACDVKNEWGVV